MRLRLKGPTAEVWAVGVKAAFPEGSDAPWRHIAEALGYSLQAVGL